MRWFHYDEGIDSSEVYLLDGPGEAELMSREEALAIARDRGLHLIPEWPERQVTRPAFCRIGAVSLPVRWEQVPEAAQAGEPDPLLWFEAPCGGRDLLTGSGGTYPGRMSAWCPDKQASYNVSLAEMGQMSQQARYYVAGFLAGNQPGLPPPPDPGADIDPGDLAAWKAAAGRFRRTGLPSAARPARRATSPGQPRAIPRPGPVVLPDRDHCQAPGRSIP